MWKRELLWNKLCALLLIAAGLIVLALDGDGTALVVVAMIAVPLFFAKEDWIGGGRCNELETVQKASVSRPRFSYQRMPKKVKAYLIELLGERGAKELISAMNRREWIIISGPHGPTGKTTLADVLRSVGYTMVLEEWRTATIPVQKPLTELRTRKDIFESLGIAEQK